MPLGGVSVGAGLMVNFHEWCENTTLPTKSSFTLVMNVVNRDEGISNVSEVIPRHYVDIESALKDLGRDELADFVRSAFPTKKMHLSGDIGEILATEWINECCDNYIVPITNLLHKDESKMAMRGVDVVGVRKTNNSSTLDFLKGEAKSRNRIVPSVIVAAQKALGKDKGRITGDTLAYIVRKMIIERKDSNMINAIRAMSSKQNIFRANIRHLIFVFSGNNPETILKESFDCYEGDIDQMYVGIYVDDHQSFIHDAYEGIDDHV